ncbi:MAG: V-type ATP synthase subunit I [Brevinema sp.]
MFTSQKMLFVDLLVLKKNMDAISKEIVKFGDFEVSNHSALLPNQTWDLDPLHDQKRMISEFQRDTQVLLEYYEDFDTQNISYQHKRDLSLPVIGDFLRNYKQEQQFFLADYKEIKKKKETCAIKMAGLRMHNELTTITANHQNIHEIRHLYSILGTIDTVNFSILKDEFESQFDGELLYEGHVNDSTIVFITVSHEREEELKTMLDHFYFKNYGLPPEFFGEGIANMTKLGLEYVLLCDEEEAIDKKIKAITPKMKDHLNQMLFSLNIYEKINSVQNQIKYSSSFAVLSGWISQKSYTSIKTLLDKQCKDNYQIYIADTDTFTNNIEIPTKLNNPKIFQPFEKLVTLFGIPHYKEIDPTVIFALLYVLMYGAMFGDFGQGAILFLIGIIGFFVKKNLRFIFGLMIWVGISSSIFGLLYGSYFGYEAAFGYNVPKAIWISPIHNINTMLMIASVFGIAVMLLSFILGVINFIRMKDWGGLIFSHKGLTAFIVYVLLLLAAYSAYTGISSPFLWTTIGILSLFLGLERVWEALIYKHGLLKDWWMGFFDMFEFFLSMLTNTLSFIRIGAFALTHAALMMAVFTLRDLAGGTGLAANSTVILGNIFIIIMEGFIVGIQTLRLEYYEFFLRFFKGTGRPFMPISSEKDKESK